MPNFSVLHLWSYGLSCEGGEETVKKLDMEQVCRNSLCADFLGLDNSLALCNKQY